MDDSDTSRSEMSANENGVDRLARVTAAYGADPARWPAAERAALCEIVAGMDAAAEKIDEERILDRLLDTVPPSDPPPDSAKRILTAAGVSSAGAQVVMFPSPPSQASPVGLRLKPAVGLIAASLLLGIVTGNTHLADPLFLDGPGDGLVEIDQPESSPPDLDLDFDADEDFP